MQASPTICPHNMTGQAAVPGRPVPCRGCGALIQPSPRSVSGNALVASQGAINAVYPGDGASSSSAWAFAQ